MPGVFTSFASSRFLNRDQVVREVKTAAKELQSQRSDVNEVYLFGSFASGIPTPKSDVDLLIVSEAPAEEFPSFFLSVSLPVDIHVMAPSIFQKRKKEGKGIVGVAVNRGIRLL